MNREIPREGQSSVLRSFYAIGEGFNLAMLHEVEILYSMTKYSRHCGDTISKSNNSRYDYTNVYL